MKYNKIIEERNLTTDDSFNNWYKNRFTSEHPYLNPEIAFNNLKDFVQILEDFNVEYYLFYGTLLGIYRDKRLIEYDHDVDIAIKASEKNFLFEIFHNFETHGFEIKRITCNSDVVSFTRDNEYIDLYVLNPITKKTW